jgi:Tol biopolymer transport system component
MSRCSQLSAPEGRKSVAPAEGRGLKTDAYKPQSGERIFRRSAAHIALKKFNHGLQPWLRSYAPPGLSAILAIIVMAATCYAQNKRPMTVDDLITAVRVSDPQLSPDNKRVVYARTTTALDSGKRNTDIWVVPADGSSAPRPFIAGEKSESSARFTPDGKRVLFISNRDGAPQVYAADAEGRGAKQITKISGGVQAPMVVSPDSKKVAFVSDVYPQCKDEDCNRRMREAQEKDPVKVRVLTGLPFRHWDEWRNNLRHHIFVTDIDTGETRDVTPGDFDSPPHFYEDAGITFSPDSRSLAFVSNREGHDKEMLGTNHDVWVVPVSGGDAKRITTNPAADDQPTYSPDGKLLAIRSQRRAGFESDRWYLDLYDQTTGMKRTLFETPDLSVEDFVFSSDGRSIFFTTNEKGLVNLYSIAVSGGGPKLVAKGA